MKLNESAIRDSQETIRVEKTQLKEQLDQVKTEMQYLKDKQAEFEASRKEAEEVLTKSRQEFDR